MVAACCLKLISILLWLFVINKSNKILSAFCAWLFFVLPCRCLVRFFALLLGGLLNNFHQNGNFFFCWAYQKKRKTENYLQQLCGCLSFRAHLYTRQPALWWCVDFLQLHLIHVLCGTRATSVTSLVTGSESNKGMLWNM